MLIAAALLALSQLPPQAQPTAPAAQSGPVRKPRILVLPDEAIAYVPATAGTRAPLLVLLHGAGRRADRMIEYLAAEADERGIVLLAPTSRGLTWDTVSRAEQPSPDSMLANSLAHRFSTSRDAARIEAAIAALGKTIAVDRSRTVLAGFSDGATFALAMGLSRDHPFSALIAWSPGIAIETSRPVRGRRVFVSHGRQDRVLSYNTDCGEIVPLLQSEGAAVSFLPFDGGHEIPQIAKDAFLDALFGPLPGAAVHPLPSRVERCTIDRPDLPSGRP